MKVAVIGATGYTGLELTRILLKHPAVEIIALTTRSKESKPLLDFIPSLTRGKHLKVETYSEAKIMKQADIVFLCLPHTQAAQTANRFYKGGKVVIDLSADLRLKNYREYEKWYKAKHGAKALLKKAVYGLPELNRKALKDADLIANPGCYPTASALAVLPLLREGLVDPKDIIIDAKSGVSGAGRKLTEATQFCSLSENFYAYKVGAHQHTPEIIQTLSRASKVKPKVTFVAHLLPVERGIFVTAYLKPKASTTLQKIEAAFRKAYAEEPFVRLKKSGDIPAIKDVQNTNYCDISYVLDKSSGRIIVTSVIDNLVKGASGQAVQNMNIRMGFPEGEGLV